MDNSQGFAANQVQIRPTIKGGAAMRFKLTLAIIASFVAAPAVFAEEATPARGVYFGGFGGGGFSTEAEVTQFGTVFFTEAEGGPLAVNAKGKSDGDGVGFVGAQVGY